MDNINNIRKALKESGRYEEVDHRLINTIDALVDDVQYPVNLHHRDTVRGRNVRKGLRIIRNVIATVDYMGQIRSAASDGDDQFVSEALDYIDSKNQMKLHNYAITISHRNTTFDDTMESIRTGLIIGLIANTVVTAIQFYNNDIEAAEETMDEFFIPDGWKRISDENGTVEEMVVETRSISASEAIGNIIEQLRELREISELSNIPIVTAHQQTILP